MTGTKLQVRLYRDSFATPWGFRLQGGKDLKQPLVVQRVFCNSPAEGQLQRGDIIDAIGIKRGVDLSHKQAQDSLKHGGGQIELAVTRPSGNVNIGIIPQNITPVSTRAPQQKPQMPQPRPYGHQPQKVTVSKYGGGGPSFGAEYGGTPASMPTQSGNYRPVEQYNMLNKVQGSLDNIILSPRTPEAFPSQAPFYQQYDPYSQPQYQEPQQQFMSTGERLDRMKELKGEYADQSAPAYDPVQPPRHKYGYQSTAERLEQVDPEDEENKVPVWERRQAFTGPSSYAHESRPIKPKRPPPKFKKPTGPVIGTDYSKCGIDYRKERPHSGVWKPQPHSQPHPHHQRSTSQPDATSYTPSPYEDGEPTVPVWRHTLKASGVKPWEEDLDFGSRQPAPEVHEAPRLVPYDPPTQPLRPSNNSYNDGDDPNVVHLQYNSPMGLYSNDKVQETIDSQSRIKAAQMVSKQPTMKPMQPAKVSQKAPGSQKAPTISGERDWTQSAVFRMVAQEESGPPHRGGGHGQRAVAAPPPAPKPSMQPAQFHQHQFQIPYDDEVGVSDF